MFDKVKFAQILNNINNTYDTMTEFAEHSKVNRTYLSQYINQKLDAPPSPKILEKIASASNGVITYEKLMLMCGYIKNELDNFADLSHQLAKCKAYIDCSNLLKSTTLTDDEATKILYYISTTNIEELGTDDEAIKATVSYLLEQVSPEHQKLVEIVLVQYWKQLLEYRKEMIEFLNPNKTYNKEQEFRFAYHKEAEGLTEEEISDALRFYKEMKKRIANDKK